MKMASIQMFDCVLMDHNKKEKDLNVLVRDQFKKFRMFHIDDSESKEDGKKKEDLECSSRSSVPETGESLQIFNPTFSPVETNSNPFYNTGQPENPSRNEIIIGGASSLVQIWEARSHQSSSSQSLIDSRTSSGISLFENSNSFYESLNEEARNHNVEIDWCSQSERSYVSDSYEKEREGKCFLELLTCAPRIRGRQVFADFLMMIMRDREKELEWLADCNAVSKFSPQGCGRLQYMLRLRCFERCIAIQERHQSKSKASDTNRFLRESGVINLRDIYKTNTGKVNSSIEARSSSSSVSSQFKKAYKKANKAADMNVLQEKTERVEKKTEKSNRKEAEDVTWKQNIAKKAVLSEAASNKNGLKKPEIERETTEEGERLVDIVEKAIEKECVGMKKTSILSFEEKVNMWDSKVRTNRRRTMEKAENESKSIEVEEYRRKKIEVSNFEEGKALEIEECRINPLEVTSDIILDKRKEEESKAEKEEALEALFKILESTNFLNVLDENVNEDDEEEDYSGENEYYDWISEISRPRSYWEDLRNQWELEVMNKDSEKDDIRNMIKRRTVSSFLASDFREKIDKILISRTQTMLQVESNLEEEEDSVDSLVDCSASYQEKHLETATDVFSQYSDKDTMMTSSFEDHKAAATLLSISSNPKDRVNNSSETQTICDLREGIKQLQREMVELQSVVKSCVDFQKFMNLESASDSVSDSLTRTCSVCFVMPVDSLLYRCGHMCTCLKCGHELQSSSRKCPICMAPILDVVRAFLDA